MLFNLILSFGLIVAAFYYLDFDILLISISRISFDVFFAFISLTAVSFFIMALRWYMIVSLVIKVDFLEQLVVYLKGAFLNSFTPANIGGDAYRVFVLKMQGEEVLDVVKLLFRERLIGLNSYIFTAILTSFQIYIFLDDEITFSGHHISLIPLSLFMFFIFPQILIILAFRMKILRVYTNRDAPVIGRTIAYLSQAQQVFCFKGVVAVYALSFLSLLIWIICNEIILRSVGLDVPFIQVAFVACLVELIRVLPLTFQGVGLREAAFSYFLSRFGYDANLCYAAGFLVYIILTCSIFMCGPVSAVLSFLKELHYTLEF